jgi:catechol 2,3-dioxygenase-like lactoylglutathione lyase family enzyme
VALTSIQHLLVLTDDIDGTRDFYRDVLGLEEGRRPPLEFPGYWLYAQGVPCVHVADRDIYNAHAASLGLAPSEGRRGSGVVDHVAFNASDYHEVTARLERHGIDAVQNTVPGIGMRQLFVSDPNGVRIEINVLPTDGI